MVDQPELELAEGAKDEEAPEVREHAWKTVSRYEIKMNSFDSETASTIELQECVGCGKRRLVKETPDGWESHLRWSERDLACVSAEPAL